MYQLSPAILRGNTKVFETIARHPGDSYPIDEHSMQMNMLYPLMSAFKNLGASRQDDEGHGMT